MAWTLPEVTVRKIIDDGMRGLRTNKAAFLEIFGNYTETDFQSDYGSTYVEQIWDWFSTTKIPVIQSWSFNPQKIPCVSVHLANEQEAEDKLAMDDFAGMFGDETTTGTAAFTVMLDIGLHANRSSDHVLWLYYITAYILFKSKPSLERLGLRMGTFSASDYSKDAEKMGNNVWTRWIRYRCTTQNFWGAESLSIVDDVETHAQTGLNVTQIATSPDVDPSTVSLTSSKGLQASRVGSINGEDDLGI